MPPNVYVHFLQVEPILYLSIFQNFEAENSYYYYFQISQTYYLFVFGKNNTRYKSTDSLSQIIRIIQVLNKKKRKIRSLRGYLLYVLEIIKNADEITELSSNLPSLFWSRVEDIIRQNQKNALDEFLFGPEPLSYQNQNLSFIHVTTNLENEIILINKKLEALEKLCISQFQLSTGSTIEIK
jgi:hypothetical protein